MNAHDATLTGLLAASPGGTVADTPNASARPGVDLVITAAAGRDRVRAAPATLGSTARGSPDTQAPVGGRILPVSAPTLVLRALLSRRRTAQPDHRPPAAGLSAREEP